MPARLWRCSPWGANLTGVASPIVTGYVVAATSNFSMAFVLTGVMLAVGVAVLLGMIKGGIGTADPAVQPRAQWAVHHSPKPSRPAVKAITAGTTRDFVNISTTSRGRREPA